MFRLPIKTYRLAYRPGQQTFFVREVLKKELCITYSVNSSSDPTPPPPTPPGLRSFPDPGGGAIAKKFQPGGGDLDVCHHGDWRIITWQILLEKILNSFANGLILILWDGLSVPLSFIIDEY